MSFQPPRLRRVDCFPVSQPGGEVVFALRDPEGFAQPIVVPYPAAVLAALMDGSRTPAQLQADFQQRTGQAVAPDDINGLIQSLDDRWYLDNERFRARWKREIEIYLNSPLRPAAHAGKAYAAEPDTLRAQFDALFTSENGPGAPNFNAAKGSSRLRAIMAPHIDFHRGGPTFAWAYKRLVEESTADVFVILGTAHNPTNSLFSVTKKDFATPLGTVETDRTLISRLAAALKTSPAGGEVNLFADELAHRQEHSIEFQAVFLQYLLGGRRPFKILPILVGSFHPFIAAQTSPADSPAVKAFVESLRQVAAALGERVCFINGSDLAHIGQRYGDRAFLDAQRLNVQAQDDRGLLDAAAASDAEQFYRHVAVHKDRNRICGLSPTYTMLETLGPTRGELLRYDQAVELDGTACVSFASMAFYDAAADGTP